VRHRSLFIVSILGVLALVASACGGGTPSNSPAASGGGGGSSGGSSGSSGSSGGGSKSGSASAVLVDDSSGAWTTWSYSPFTTTFPGAAAGFVLQPLAIQSWPSLTKFIPQMATSWTVKGNQLLVNLQPKATWQNGQPVTSKDVVDTIELDGANGSAVWNDISNVTATSAKQVALTLRPGVPSTNLITDLFNGVTPYPASVWGQFVTPTLKADDISYYTQQAKDPAAALKSPAFTRLQAVLTKLTKYDPKSIVGDGPYKLATINLQEAELKKWDGYYDAAHITIPEIIFEGTAQSQVNAQLLSNRVDFSSGWLYMPPAILQQWLKTSDAHLLAVPGTFQGVVVWNDSEAPFNNVKVRQALTYAFPIAQMDELSWGTQDAHAVPPAQPDGLIQRIQAQFLTKSQIASLNTYAYNQAKAAQILQSVGWTKKGGHWYLPDGKQFKLTLSIDAAWTDQVAAFKVATTALNGFGIDANESLIEDTTYSNDLHTGNFQLAAYCCAGGTPNALEDFVSSPMGSVENFTSSGSDKGDKGIAYGPVEPVPGVGTVNIPATLNQEYAVTSPGPKLNKLVWDWAKFVNDQVPYVPYAIFANQIAFSSKRFTWPSTSNPLWVEVNNGSYALVIAQERGLLHPN
jgi:peptide/nickel transport system substrate-binding protein